MIRPVLLTATLIWSDLAIACSRPALGLTWSTDELIDRTSQIVLAAAVPTTGGGIRLDIIEFLKGGPPLKLPGLRRLHRGIPTPHTDFRAHTDPYFWIEGVGRPFAWLPGSCHPSRSFLPGQRYLIFSDFDALSHGKAAELIRHDFDLWLNYVRTRTSASPGGR